MLVSDLNIQKKLLDLGYANYSNKAAKIFATSLDNVFFGFGEIIQNGLIAEAKKQKLPIIFKFPYYSMVETSIVNFAGETSGKKILDKINEELTKQTKIQGSNEEILNEISKRETFEMIDNFSGHEHVIYLWNKENTRDDILTHFFKGTKGPKGVISPKNTSFPNIKNITYGEIFEGKTEAINKFQKSILEKDENIIRSEPTRIAGSDSTTWFDQGLGKECLQMENLYEKNSGENLTSVICSYDIKKIPNETILKSLIDCHQFVLLDDPFVIYERGN